MVDFKDVEKLISLYNTRDTFIEDTDSWRKVNKDIDGLIYCIYKDSKEKQKKMEEQFEKLDIEIGSTMAYSDKDYVVLNNMIVASDSLNELKKLLNIEF